MYPNRELTALAARKVALRQAIALRRDQCAAAAARATRPLEWMDRVLILWRQLPAAGRYAAIPLGWVVLRGILRRLKYVRSFVRWSPLLFAAVRVLRATVRTRTRRSPA
jgi:hypothetical protein